MSSSTPSESFSSHGGSQILPIEGRIVESYRHGTNGQPVYVIMLQ
jgi:hypothetical protein